MPTFQSTSLVWLFGIIFTCETSKYTDNVIEFKCPLSKSPISFDEYERFVDQSPGNSTDYWTPCLLPDYSCAKVKVPKRGYLFACLPDFGEIKPAFFHYFKPTGIHKVTLENYLSLSKGCGNIGNTRLLTTITTVTYLRVTFVTELSCCKGVECSGKNWRRIWDDNDYTTGEFNGRDNLFWYTGILFTGTLLSFIVCKSSFLTYQRLKERLVLESLKTISRTVKEADDEDKIKRRSAVSRFFRLRRRQKKKDHSITEGSSQKTHSVEALIKSNKK